MKLRCLIIDDQLYAIKSIHRLILSNPNLEFVASETDPLIGLGTLERGEIKVDLVFLDIDMPQISGMELAPLIKPYAEIIFVTSHESYAVKSYEHRALDYLLKPVSPERFNVSIEKAIEKFSGRSGMVIDREKYFFVPGDRKGKLTRIIKDDVIFIESIKNYLTIHLTTGNVITYLTLSEFEETVNYGSFIRVHKSFIINIDKVKSKDNNFLYLDANSSVVVGRTYQKTIEDKLKELTILSGRRTKKD